jgi:hypothetical protein
MPQRHDNLFDPIANFQALRAAARRAVKGKRKKPGAAAFFANLEIELAIFRSGWFDPAQNPEAWTAPCRRVLRGGSWNNNPRNLRAANRNRNTAENRNNNNGFRLGSTLSAGAGVITVPPGAH